MNCSTPGLPVHHHLPEFTQTHIHRVGDAIQPSHPLSSPSPPAPNPSQHQSLFQWVNSFHEVAKVLEFQLQHHSFPRNPRADLLQNGLVGSPCSPRDSQGSSPTPQYILIVANFKVTFICGFHWFTHSLATTTKIFCFLMGRFPSSGSPHAFNSIFRFIPSSSLIPRWIPFCPPECVIRVDMPKEMYFQLWLRKWWPSDLCQLKK